MGKCLSVSMKCLINKNMFWTSTGRVNKVIYQSQKALGFSIRKQKSKCDK